MAEQLEQLSRGLLDEQQADLSSQFKAMKLVEHRMVLTAGIVPAKTSVA